jgi:hypothetical protein
MDRPIIVVNNDHEKVQLTLVLSSKSRVEFENGLEVNMATLQVKSEIWATSTLHHDSTSQGHWTSTSYVI